MKDQFTTYEIALKLKELGFNEPCLAIYTHLNEFYDKGTFLLHHPHPFTIEELTPIVKDVRINDVYILAPLWQQAIDYLRDNHQIHINFVKPIGEYTEISVIDHNKDSRTYADTFNIIDWTNLSEGREKAILKAIELVENNNNQINTGSTT